ncbi:DISARM system phospholipase D-like protein DrmC [Oryzomonas rubra]|uniref:PLD phosphodiesterase domain-containing protein n=1 Tax=Oryzomonas rubra TaxID=2509454 RepID=A0A5A9XT60_9BACT|nr:DISARM system phospholipase D-like protein DrmC [Oryzomonas rubra]KAA0895458.1 hypothetical protein ET418_02760 [Oryzomonas rubra]
MRLNLDALHALSTANLRALATSFRDGQLAMGLTAASINQLLCGCDVDVLSCLETLVSNGMGAPQCALLLDAITNERERAPDLARLFEPVLSGPDVPGVPTGDTAAAMQMLVQEARKEVLLVGYAVYNGERLFEPLALRMRENPELKVTFCLNIARRFGDTSLDSEVVNRYALDFHQKHWPWPELPELYYDPRALSESSEHRASLHAKCVVVDHRAALITSANFTDAAQYRNIEMGLLVRHSPLAERVADYFEGLRLSGHLLRCPL